MAQPAPNEEEHLTTPKVIEHLRRTRADMPVPDPVAADDDGEITIEIVKEQLAKNRKAAEESTKEIKSGAFKTGTFRRKK